MATLNAPPLCVGHSRVDSIAYTSFMDGEIMSRDAEADYYDTGGIETLDIVKAKLTPEQYEGYLLGTAIVYLCRMNWKGDKKGDARKGANYTQWLRDWEEATGNAD